MEHLSRNTQNEKLIAILESIKTQNNNAIKKELKRFEERIYTIASGILSSILSKILMEYIGLNNITFTNALINLVLFFAVFIIIWLILACKIFPYIEKRINKHGDLKRKDHNEVVRYFNIDIMQKIAEINEALTVAIDTDDIECRSLNLVTSFYKWKIIIIFIKDNILNQKDKIRISGSDIPVEFLENNFNEYNISIVINVLNHINKKLEVLLQDDDIKLLKGYELLYNDYKYLKVIFNNIDSQLK